MPSTEAGHHEKRVYLHMDGSLVIPSSASILIEGSTSASRNSGAGIINRNIGLTTSRTTTVGAISNSGVTLICTTGIGVLRLAAPVKGAIKTLIWVSTAANAVKVRVAGADPDDSVKITGSLGKVNPTKGATVIFPSSDVLKVIVDQKYAVGGSVTLVGYSTSRWLIQNVTPGECTGVKYWTLSTSS